MPQKHPSFECLRDDYQIVRLANGCHSVYSQRYGETYHPVIGPVAEAEALYIRQTALASRAAACDRAFVVWDVGLGSGANALSLLRALRNTAAHLTLVSFDRTLEPLRFALQHQAALEYFDGYALPAERLLATGQIEFWNGELRVRWSLVQADFPSWLKSPVSSLAPKPDVILFDPHSPARNPEMWTQSLLDSLFGALDPNRPCMLPTYSRSTLLRVSLLLAGFFVGRGEATGEKEETTLAANQRELLSAPLGIDWLERVKRSRSAEPLWEPVYQQQPIRPSTWQRLLAHPQFSEIHREQRFE